MALWTADRRRRASVTQRAAWARRKGIAVPSGVQQRQISTIYDECLRALRQRARLCEQVINSAVALGSETSIDRNGLITTALQDRDQLLGAATALHTAIQLLEFVALRHREVTQDRTSA